jgi:hypothetical protein
MGNVVFYRDALDTFECDVKIEGASADHSKSRLVLEFSDRTLLFTGAINDGHVSIKIPKLSEISDKSGEATLEIIADQTFFEAWSAPFDLKNKKSVGISEVTINDDSSKRIVVENVSKESKPQVKDNGIIKKSCSTNNRRAVSESFKRFKSMSDSEKKKIKTELRSFEPKIIVENWADSVFNDSDTQYAKYCMYEMQQGKFRKSN